MYNGSCVRYNDNFNAVAFHNWAMKLVGENDFREATNYFRAAVRADPSVLMYWNDLGVTEMNIGEYEKAYERFHYIVSVDSNHIDVWDNLQVLRESYPFVDEQIRFNMSYEDPEKCTVEISPPVDDRHLNKYQTHKIDIIEEIEFSDLFGNYSFLSKSVLHRPFIIRNITDSLHWNRDAVNVFRLLDSRSYADTRRAWGSYNADFYPHNMSKYLMH